MGYVATQEEDVPAIMTNADMPGPDLSRLSQTTVIVGMGGTGLSCVRFLAARGEPLLVMDNRPTPPLERQVRELLDDAAVITGSFHADLLCHCKQIVLSPGVSLQTAGIAAAVSDGVPVIGDIELFARHAHAPVIAITGSNGKSTVTALLSAMAKTAGKDVRTGANFGTPALDLLDEHEPDCYILELSSFQLETTSSLNAAAAVLLNVSPDHMDRYATTADYLTAKLRVYRGDGVMVINRDEQLLADSMIRGRRVVGFTLARPAGSDYGIIPHQGQDWIACGEQALMPAADIALTGRHNLANALAALALGQAIGLPHETMCRTLREFSGLPHRMQRIATVHGVTYFNDSKGTNVGATLAALQGIEGKVVLIAGGQAKGGDFRPWREPLSRWGRAVVLIGQDAALIESQLQGAVTIEHATDMTQAVRLAGTLAQAGDSVLLSPGCASFDMFSGYAQRGDVFVAAVRELER